ncbi:hypothetical protein OKA04_22570 [Luteolibacter flavescens]|uniref:Uncharacterized protein n=1 Tax=Luteolibacter flavescens TaxID=1859460 RepID=A0ABT3FVC3_9BACT|nr:hypothetical protein [Luteolibacter flavescens]MCW1887538.1 hypothetical protein [Luteolibacter flavescens]
MKRTRHHDLLSRAVARGFALPVVLLLMVVLAVLALGLMTLSTVSLRAATAETDRQVARANARLALSLALGQLQKAAGPDQRISAPATLLSEDAHPAKTGIWESYKLSPEGDDDMAVRKRRRNQTDDADGEFVTWLSSPGASDVLDPEGGSVEEDGITLFPGHDGRKALSAEAVHVSGGAAAWAAADEGVKTRIDLPVESGLPDELAAARLRAPARSAAEVLPGLGGLVAEGDDAGKLASLAQGDLLAGRAALDGYRDDLTVWSASLPVNVADGGLKVDLTRAFEGDTLPAAFQGRHVYSGTTTPLVPADPMYSTLADWYRLSRHEAGSVLETRLPRDYKPVVKRYDSATRTVVSSPNPAATDGMMLAPVVTRVQVVFSLVAREAHEPWYSTLQGIDPKLKYMLYLIYTPAVTLYNPYNRSLAVDDLKVSFKHLPLAFQFYRNGMPETQRPALLSQMHGVYENRDDWEDEFVARLRTSPGSQGGAKITLRPGESRIYGLNHPRGTTWPQMLNFIYQGGQTSKTTDSLMPGPGWDYRGGYIVDVLRPNAAGRAPSSTSHYIIGMRGTDVVDVACSLRPPANGKVSQFGIEISAKVGGADSLLGVYQYRYKDASTLEAALSGNHPSLGRIRFPFRRERPWAVDELYQRRSDSDPVETWTGPKPFAIFSLADRTSLDSLHAGRPVRENSFVHHVLDLDLAKSRPGTLPLEASFLPILNQSSGTEGSIETDAEGGDRVYHHSGVTADSGVLDFSSYEMPRTSPVNVASLGHANLAGSGHLPLPTYTVGESFAHPLLPRDRAVHRGGGAGYDMADHSWLANHALWDGCYFSGIRDAAEAERFHDGEPLPLNPRHEAWTDGDEDGSAYGAAVTGAEGWHRTAARQMMKGGFNVNSTSVAAWRALLASGKSMEIPVINPVNATESTVTSAAAAYPRVLPSLSAETGPWDQDRDRSWTGFRVLSDEENEKLAEAIVREVRARGPFLSMSEFVNRSLVAGDAALAGTLQAAIRHAGINPATIPDGRPISAQDVAAFGYANPDAACGDALEAGQASLTQGDLLAGMGSTLTVRSDTFVLRGYGDARDDRGSILARAWCEAVVQRIPEFIDPADAADGVIELPRADGIGARELSEVNRRFGRRFRVVAFRWLSPAEVHES